MSSHPHRSLIGALFVLALGPSVGFAQEAEQTVASEPGEEDANGRAFYEAGRIAYDEARFDVALENFQLAYDMSRRPELLFNVGLAQERLGDDAAALESFQRYLELATEGADRPAVERRVAVLRRRLEAREEGEGTTAAWALLVSGGALGVGGAVALGIGVSRRNSVTGSENGELRWDEAEARFDRGSASMVAGIVALGAGVALSAVSVVLLRNRRGTTVSTNGSMVFVSGHL